MLYKHYWTNKVEDLPICLGSHPKILHDSLEGTLQSKASFLKQKSDLKEHARSHKLINKSRSQRPSGHVTSRLLTAQSVAWFYDRTTTTQIQQSAIMKCEATKRLTKRVLQFYKPLITISNIYHVSALHHETVRPNIWNQDTRCLVSKGWAERKPHRYHCLEGYHPNKTSGIRQRQLVQQEECWQNIRNTPSCYHGAHHWRTLSGGRGTGSN